MQRNPNFSATRIAELLELTPGRIRQIISRLKLKPVERIGNSPLYSSAQMEKIESRNTKPGPKGANGKGKQQGKGKR